MNKYHNTKSKSHGITFHSKRERDRYEELLLLEKAGEISDLKLQPSYVIHDKFIDRDNKRQREIKYIADFQYYDVMYKSVVVEDVKGVATDVFKLKRKLFKKRYPKVIFLES